MPSSGLSDLISSFFTNLVNEYSSPGSPLTISAEPPVEGAGSKDVGLTVIHFFGSFVLTVANAVSYTHLTLPTKVYV